MPNSTETTHSVLPYSMRCLICRTPIPAQSVQCPGCRTPIAPGTVEVERQTPGTPPVAAVERSIPDTESFLPSDASVVLRLPSVDATFTVPVKQPMMVGRGVDPKVNGLFDLTDYHGQKHGISRHHCQLFRQGSELYATDMGSTNGTTLNGHPLHPYQQYKISHGDQLVLGTMPIVVLFSNQG